MCGEHINNLLYLSTSIGSSPLVRGTYPPSKNRFQLVRFIPACAGNILALACIIIMFAVHPRLCGEHGLLPLYGYCRVGSSPLVRGTLWSLLILSHKDRFIPACAGNIVSRLLVRSFSSVHPRLCGEHTKSYLPKK